jgi:hypothetical protein
MARYRKASVATAKTLPLQKKFELGTELGPGAHPIGRDPRQMAPKELLAMGHRPMPVLSAVRAFCVWCCGGSTHEVQKCTAVSCALWQFRMGTNPHRKPASPAQREHARTLRAKRGRKPPEAHRLSPPDAEPTMPVPEWGFRKP